MSRIFNMTQNSMNTPYAKRVAEKFREAKNYLKTNGFNRSTKHLLEDIENSVEKECQYPLTFRIYNMATMMALQPLFLG